MNTSLPEPMKEYAEEQVLSGDHSSVSEYMRALVREDQKRPTKEQLEQLLLDSLKSGDTIEVTPELAS